MLLDKTIPRHYNREKLRMGEGWLVVKSTAPLLVLAAGILWGLMGIFVRTLASFGFSSLEIAGLRIFFGAMLFAAITAAARPEQLKIRLRDAGLFVGMGLLSLLLFTMCYFSVIRMASLSVAAILLYTSPIWVMLMSLACFHEPMTRRKILAAAMAFGGCVLVSGPGSAEQLSLPVLAIGLLSAVGVRYVQHFRDVCPAQISAADRHDMGVFVWCRGFAAGVQPCPRFAGGADRGASCGTACTVGGHRICHCRTALSAVHGGAFPHAGQYCGHHGIHRASGCYHCRRGGVR